MSHGLSFIFQKRALQRLMRSTELSRSCLLHVDLCLLCSQTSLSRTQLPRSQNLSLHTGSTSTTWTPGASLLSIVCALGESIRVFLTCRSRSGLPSVPDPARLGLSCLLQTCVRMHRVRFDSLVLVNGFRATWLVDGKLVVRVSVARSHAWIGCVQPPTIEPNHRARRELPMQ